MTEVEQVGAKVAQTRRRLARDMAALAAVVRTAAEQGVPDTELARQAGVARDTIRRMLGKAK